MKLWNKTVNGTIESLELYTNNIVSIEALTGLNKLTQLSLSHNKVSDISPLAQCLSLESISIGNNNVTDISPIFYLNLKHFT